jgi:D-glycerate 3-kinase
VDRKRFTSYLTDWLHELIARSPPKRRPVIVDLSAPQGASKTTLTGQICRRLASRDGLNAVSISIDDFYVTRREQADLATRYIDNPYLQHRGYPGTHDINLGRRVLNALKSIDEYGSVVLPAYDRMACRGMGDRRLESDWPIILAPLDLVILEGWMLGFASVEPDMLPDRHLRLINEFLRPYATWLSCLDAFVWLEPEDSRFVLDWRVEAEEQSRAQERGGMSIDEVKAFAERFLPAYLIYLPGLRERSPVRGPFLHVLIGHNRLPSH